jgi:hypothetical protein
MNNPTPEIILEAAEALPRRVIRIEANIIAYFGDYFNALRQGFTSAPVSPARRAQSDTASAQNPS